MLCGASTGAVPDGEAQLVAGRLAVVVPDHDRVAALLLVGDLGAVPVGLADRAHASGSALQLLPFHIMPLTLPLASMPTTIFSSRVGASAPCMVR